MNKLVAVMMIVAGLTVPAIGENVFNMPGDSLSLEFVSVLNVGNTADYTGFGAVDYGYAISTYEVTAGQYTQFLNAVAATDTYLLYNTYMSGPGFDIGSNSFGCEIVQSGSSGSYTYAVSADRANRPVNFVGWGDAVRFTNWLHNGQPTGLQGAGTTETGAYNLNGATENIPLLGVTRQAGAKYAIPTENEWYKAAYHKNDGNTGNYFDYPTSSDRAPASPTLAVWDPNAGDSDAEYGPYNAATFLTGTGYYPGGVDGYWQSEVDIWEESESPYDTLGQGGNVAEWTEAIAYTSIPVTPGRVTRGGSWDIGVHMMKSDRRKVISNWDPQREDEDPVTYWNQQPIYLGSVDFRHTGIRIVRASVATPGDLNDDGVINGEDIDLMGDAIHTGVNPTAANYDLSANGTGPGTDGDVDLDDLDYLVRFLVETTAVDALGNPIFGTEYGDFNLDGEVELGDLTRLGTYYGIGDKWSEGNANRYLDMLIELGDLTILGTYYGASNGGVDAIPEPMTLLLMGCGAAGLLRRRRQARRGGRV